jgi:hypothetical protein
MALIYHADGSIERSNDAAYYSDKKPVIVRKADWRTKTDEEIEAAQHDPETAADRWHSS